MGALGRGVLLHQGAPQALSCSDAPRERSFPLAELPGPPLALLVGTPDAALREQPGLGGAGKVEEEGQRGSQWLFLNSHLSRAVVSPPAPFCSSARAGGPQLPYLVPVVCQDRAGGWRRKQQGGLCRSRPPLLLLLSAVAL